MREKVSTIENKTLKLISVAQLKDFNKQDPKAENLTFKNLHQRTNLLQYHW